MSNNETMKECPLCSCDIEADRYKEHIRMCSAEQQADEIEAYQQQTDISNKEGEDEDYGDVIRFIDLNDDQYEGAE